MKTYLLFIMSIIFTSGIYAQSISKNVILHNAVKSVEYEKPVETNHFFESEYKRLGLRSPSNMIQKYEVKDKSGFIHTKFKQTYQGLSVIGGTYILHQKNGKVIKSNGHLLPNINLNTKPNISVRDAAEEANYFLIERFSNEYEKFDPSQFNLQVIESKLCIIDQSYPDFSGQYHLAYEVLIESFLNIPIKEKIYVDANTNEIITSFSDIAQEDVIGKGTTLYYGEKEFNIDSVGPNKFLLQDLTRGNGIFTIDASQDYNGSLDHGYPVFESDSKNWSFSNPKDAAALDAHFSTIQYYDLLKTRFDRNSIDNEGAALISAVHVFSPFYVNATWNGERTNYGDGNCDDYGPLTTIDIIGHEFTHGLTDYTSNLVYKNESGAINESISDIFGKALEYYTIPDDFNWLLGNTMITGDDVEPFRNMADPNAVGDPKFYFGEDWKTGAGDNGGVHTNSNVFNHWFYLLVDGKAGKNEINYDYDVTPIGMDKALDIVYGVETGYLTESSGYIDLFFATIDEAKDLYGENSMEVANVIEAWKAVGIDLDKTLDNLGVSFVEDIRSTVYLCDFSTPYEINYSIQNNGTDNKLPGSAITVEYKINSNILETKEFTLTDTLKFKDFLTITDSVYLTEELLPLNTNRLKITLLSDDSNMYDNELEIRIKNLLPNVDLRASMYTNSLRDLCTPIQNQGLRCRVQNKSCTTLNQGETIEFIFENENGKFTQAYTFTQDLEPNRTKFISLRLEDLPIDFGPFDITLKFDDDTNLDNNSFLYDGPGVYKSMPRNVAIDFSDDSYNGYIKFRPSFYNKVEVVNFDNNDQLGFLGERNFGRLAECVDPNDFFISQNYSEIGFCVNASDMNDPMVSFDLTFIQNQTLSEFSISDDYYTMTKVFLEEMEFPLIYSQTSELKELQEIKLPAGYEGIVKIAVYVLGNEETGGSDIFQENNWVLLDNLKFYDREDVSTKDISISQFDVSPNPTAGIVTFSPKNKSQEYEVRLYNILGHEIEKISNIEGDLHYDISTIGSGTIFYQILENDIKVNFGKLIVIE